MYVKLISLRFLGSSFSQELMKDVSGRRVFSCRCIYLGLDFTSGDIVNNVK